MQLFTSSLYVYPDGLGERANDRNRHLGPFLWGDIFEDITFSSSFEHLATGDQVEHAKPAPDLFLLAAQKLGIAPHEAIAWWNASAVHGIAQAHLPGRFTHGPAPAQGSSASEQGWCRESSP